jgi:midasin
VQVLESVMKVKLDPDALYTSEGARPRDTLQAALDSVDTRSERDGGGDGGGGGAAAEAAAAQAEQLRGIVWTRALQRMYCLVRRCLQHSEPALLVGDTGVGKTTLCQMLAFMRCQKLHIVNCNRNTEAADILGGFRPNRRRPAAVAAYLAAFNDAVRCAARRIRAA